MPCQNYFIYIYIYVYIYIEIKPMIVMAKAAFNKKKTLLLAQWT